VYLPITPSPHPTSQPRDLLYLSYHLSRNRSHAPVVSSHGAVTLSVTGLLCLLVHGEWFFGRGTTLFQLYVSSETWSHFTYLKSATLLNPFYSYLFSTSKIA